MERKLVTIRTITEIKPHTNADKLELAIIDGWQVVVGKGEFKEGQRVVYFEIDSLIPVIPEFEFLRKYCYIKKDWLADVVPNGEAFRIKTIKLRGELSQGLIIPISAELEHDLMYAADTDELLNTWFNVVKYDPPQILVRGPGESCASSFPSFIPKTKQERIQNITQAELTDIFSSDETFEVTRKYNGSSITVYTEEVEGTLLQRLKASACELFGVKSPKHYRVGVCSRNMEIDITSVGNKFAHTAKTCNLIDGLRQLSETLGVELAVQGELCGPGVQENYHSLPKLRIFIFDIYNITESRYLLPRERGELVCLLQEKYNVLADHAIVEYYERRLFSDDRHVLISLAEYTLPNGVENEGLVFKSCIRDFSFKCISNRYLLKNE